MFFLDNSIVLHFDEFIKNNFVILIFYTNLQYNIILIVVEQKTQMIMYILKCKKNIRRKFDENALDLSICRIESQLNILQKFFLTSFSSKIIVKIAFFEKLLVFVDNLKFQKTIVLFNNKIEYFVLKIETNNLKI